MKNKRAKYNNGGTPSYRDSYYESGAKLSYYKQLLNNKLREKNPEAYDNFFSGLRDVISQTGVDIPTERRKYIENSDYNFYLTPKEVRDILGDRYDDYLNSIKTINQYNLDNRLTPLYGDIEGEGNLEDLNYGRRFATFPVTPSISIERKTPSGDSRRYSRFYKFNPETNTVDYIEEGDLSIRPEYLKNSKNDVATNKFQNGGKISLDSLLGVVPEAFNTIIDTIENPIQISEQPLVDIKTLNRTQNPYRMQQGGEAALIQQLQQEAEAQGIMLEELIERLRNKFFYQGQDEENLEEADYESYSGNEADPSYEQREDTTPSYVRRDELEQEEEEEEFQNDALYETKPVLEDDEDLEEGLEPYVYALGGKAMGIPIEAEGGEGIAIPGLPLGEIKGPKHEQGGVKLEVPPETKIYSDRLKINGKTAKERKEIRERKLERIRKNIERSIYNDLERKTSLRSIAQIEAEEEMDTNIQNIATILHNASNRSEEDLGERKKFATGGVPSRYPNNYTYNVPGYLHFNAPEPITSPYEVKGIADKFPKITNIPNIQDKMADTSKDDPVYDLGELTLGDAIGLTGTAIGAISPLFTTLNNRDATPPNQNHFLGFGQDALDDNERAMDIISENRGRAMSTINSYANAMQSRNRAASQGINTMRAMDIATQLGVNRAYNEMEAGNNSQIASLLSERGRIEMMQDNAEMKGASMAAEADRMDMDNFYTNLSENLVNLGSGLGEIARNLNIKQHDKEAMAALSLLNKYGMTVGRNKSGKFVFKKIRD